MPKLTHSLMATISFGGEVFTRNEDGSFDIPAEHAASAKDTFGMVDFVEPEQLPEPLPEPQKKEESLDDEIIKAAHAHSKKQSKHR